MPAVGVAAVAMLVLARALRRRHGRDLDLLTAVVTAGIITVLTVLPAAFTLQGLAQSPPAYIGPVNSRPVTVPPAKVGLSTSSVYPETTSSAFELAAGLGYDGVELMVGIDPVAADIDRGREAARLPPGAGAVGALPLPADHPAGLGHRPVGEAGAVGRGGPPARRRRRGRASAVPLAARVCPRVRRRRRRLAEETGITFAVENMYPVADPGGELKAYMPGWDPTELDYDDLTLDFSHASTSTSSPSIWPRPGGPAAARPPDRRHRLGQGRAPGAGPR